MVEALLCNAAILIATVLALWLVSLRINDVSFVAPTSAPLVKMPPPSRAKIEISELPKANPTSGPRSGAAPVATYSSA